jgi:hypothetical protein
MKQDADGHLSMADEIAAGADDAFLKESAMKLSASLALDELVIHELLPQAPLNATPTNSSFVYRGKNAKEMKKIIANLKTNAEKSANESLSSFKDYSLQGITLEEQEQYLQSCVNKSNLTKSSENDRLYDAPCLGKATEEQKRLLADFCEELDQIIGGKCNSRNYFYFFILAKILISKFTTWIVAFLYYF